MKLWSRERVDPDTGSLKCLDVEVCKQYIWADKGKFADRLQASQFGRGLPKREHFQNVRTQEIFRDIILKGFSTDTKSREAMDSYKSGFLHKEIDHYEDEFLVFPSPLHLW